jgi:hypothetical protein
MRIEFPGTRYRITRYRYSRRSNTRVKVCRGTDGTIAFSARHGTERLHDQAAIKAELDNFVRGVKIIEWALSFQLAASLQSTTSP